MRVGIGLPAAVPDTDMTTIGQWAEDAERAGFESVGVIDRLIYDNLDPLTALAAAAARTSRIELASTVVNVRWPSAGWVAPLFDLAVLRDGAEALGRAWKAAGREGEPRVATGRYFSLGPDAGEAADDYIHHYYGSEFFEPARADTLTKPDQIRAELLRLSEAGCTDLLLFPCSGGLEQVTLLAEAVNA